MNVGVPRERRPSEFRVGLTPAGVSLLLKDGHTCYVESQAGVGSGFSDEEYREAGANIVYTGEEVYGRANLVLKAARPTDGELNWFVPGQAIAGLLHLPAARPNKVEALLKNEITAIAYDQIQRDDGVLPILKPLSQIGGKMAVHLAAELLQNNAGGKGVLLGGVPGVPSAEVIIIGGGVVGETAAKAFIALGAQVTVLDKSLDRLQILDNHLGGRLVTLVAHPFNLARACSYADVVIGAVHIAGERAPVVITREIMQKMRKGAIFLDLSIDEGGCSETSRPTTHHDPTYIEEGILHCCIPNLPGVVARTATHAFLNAAWPYIQEIANMGIDAAIHNNRAIERGVTTHAGKILNLKHAFFKSGISS